MLCVMSSYGKGGCSALFSQIGPPISLPPDHPIVSNGAIQLHCSERITLVAALPTSRPSHSLPSVHCSDPLEASPEVALEFNILSDLSSTADCFIWSDPIKTICSNCSKRDVPIETSLLDAFVTQTPLRLDHRRHFEQ